jgi:hypothetical protein
MYETIEEKYFVFEPSFNGFHHVKSALLGGGENGV